MKLDPPTSRALKVYGLTQDDWKRQYAHQGGRCYICRRTFTRKRLPHNDHRHRDGVFRGLLCSPCNGLLGYLHEDIAWLRNAAEYLSIPPSEAVFETPRLHRDAPGRD